MCTRKNIVLTHYDATETVKLVQVVPKSDNRNAIKPCTLKKKVLEALYRRWFVVVQAC